MWVKKGKGTECSHIHSNYIKVFKTFRTWLDLSLQCHNQRLFRKQYSHSPLLLSVYKLALWSMMTGFDMCRTKIFLLNLPSHNLFLLVHAVSLMFDVSQYGPVLFSPHFNSQTCFHHEWLFRNKIELHIKLICSGYPSPTVIWLWVWAL